jgi:hypothetical protein
MPEYEDCTKCAEYQELLNRLLKTLASMMPLVPNQESYLAKALRHSIKEIREMLDKESDAHWIENKAHQESEGGVRKDDESTWPSSHQNNPYEQESEENVRKNT